MQHLFCPYQESIELKQLGFEEDCFGWYFKDKSFYTGLITINSGFLLAPLYQQAFDFLLPIAQRGLGFDEIVLVIYSYDLIEKLYGSSQTETILASGKLESLQKLIEIAKTKINL